MNNSLVYRTINLHFFQHFFFRLIAFEIGESIYNQNTTLKSAVLKLFKRSVPSPSYCCYLGSYSFLLAADHVAKLCKDNEKIEMNNSDQQKGENLINIFSTEWSVMGDRRRCSA